MSVDIKLMDVITDAKSVSVHRKFRMTWVASAEMVGHRTPLPEHKPKLSEYRGFW